ncbi:SPB6 protein, partial [Polyodon spathula]|nr:SPB6 protein [Polyodon spathula]
RLLIMESLASANTIFALDLFKKLSNDRKAENIFYSPLSISSALAMVYLGARGNTAAEMAQVVYLCNKNGKLNNSALSGFVQQSVHFNKSQDDVHSGFRALISDINKQGAPYKLCLANRLYGEKSFDFIKDDVHSGFRALISDINKQGAPYKLCLANRLYGEKSFDFIKEFIQDTKKFYQAELEAVDFVNASEAARQNINSWVQNHTQDKIQNLLAKGTVDDLTRLVLVNAIYFKGNWGKKFSESETRERSFRLSKNGTKPVQMMQQKAKFNLTFIPEVNSQIIELPYVGDELSMLIILPTEIEDDSTGLEKLERELTFENLMKWTKPEMMGNTEVTVTLPKFKLEETYDLKSVLISLGMVDAFDVGKSDFSGMSSNNELVLSKVVHKSFVEVNEEGTEAAGATGAIMMLDCLRIPVQFNADHPFLFFIRHNKTHNILFYGRFSSP